MKRREVAAFARPLRTEHVAERVAQRALEPHADRHAEALLAAMDDLGRQQARGHVLENAFRRPSRIFMSAGRRAAKSMTRLSSSGTLDSIECAMLMRSTFTSTSSGR